MITDPISDLIIRLKNGTAAGKAKVSVRHSKLAENIAHALKKAGYISGVGKNKQSPYEMDIDLLYFDTGPRIHGVERVSKPSRRIYQKCGDIRTVKSGYGNAFLSTPKGILIDSEAKRSKVGGEVLFKIW